MLPDRRSRPLRPALYRQRLRCVLHLFLLGLHEYVLSVDFLLLGLLEEFHLHVVFEALDLIMEDKRSKGNRDEADTHYVPKRSLEDELIN